MRPSKPGLQTSERRALSRPPCELTQRRRSCEARAWVFGAAGWPGVWASWPGADRNAAVQVAGAGAQRAAPSGPSRVGNNIAIVWFVRRPHPLGQFAPFESGCFFWSVVPLVYCVFACRLGRCLSVKKYQSNVRAAGRTTGSNIASPVFYVTCLLHLLSSCTPKQRPRCAAVGGILRQASPAGNSYAPEI